MTLTDRDIAAFFADWTALPQERYLRFYYRFVPTVHPRQAAAGLCAEQSTAMWQRLGVEEDLRPQFGAKVIRLERVGAVAPEVWELEIAHPWENFGAALPNLLVAAAGEGAFCAPDIATIKLLDLAFPLTYLAQFAGPQFGVEGLRARLALYDRPFFIGVVKPNLGLAPADFAQLAYEAWCGGLDIAKDDEMQADAVWSPLGERMRVAVAARDRAQREMGERKAYLANITDEVERIPVHCRLAREWGVDIVMINPIWTGISVLRMVRGMSEMPVMAHFAGAAACSRQPHFGVASVVFTKLMRLAGADLIGIAGFGERMQTGADEIQANITACLAPMGSIRPALPVPGGNCTAETLAALVTRLGHTDFGFIAGRGIFAHPNGPRAGAQRVRAAWRTKRLTWQRSP